MDAYDWFMVNCNLRAIAKGADSKIIIQTLRNNGYNKVANEVEKQFNKPT